jgi:hypothetical protein
MLEHTGVWEAPCQVRLGEPCRLCVPGATGPQDCGLVYLVMTDPDLRAELARMRAERWPEPAGPVSVR